MSSRWVYWEARPSDACPTRVGRAPLGVLGELGYRKGLGSLPGAKCEWRTLLFVGGAGGSDRSVSNFQTAWGSLSASSDNQLVQTRCPHMLDIV